MTDVMDKTMVPYLNVTVGILFTLASFVILFLVQLKIISMVRSTTNMLLFYGKQIEEIRKIIAGGPQTRRVEVSSEDTGLYEVLSE